MERTVDFLIIGTGIAGLTAARILGPAGETFLTTKGKIEDSATEMAQGGIAAAIHEEDSPQAHLEDTLAAGAGLCNPEAVRILVEEGPERVRELITLGAHFDRDGEAFELTMEGAHRRRRIFHAGDATGAEIGKTLGHAILREQKVVLHDFLFIADLIIVEGRCVGAWGWDLKRKEPITIWAKAIILSTGGLGQIYQYTTNPRTATGDGIAMAFRASAEIKDMEFIQFHPTALALPTGNTLHGIPTSIFLISEAVRGEGAILLNQHGKRFMPTYHAQAELAPRDVVARAIWQEMRQDGASHVLLSLEKISKEKILKRFPTIHQHCLAFGLNIAEQAIPVAPAAHYAMGGVKTNLWGETNIPGLFAAGEVAVVGVHGANRLASNSLLDGLVFGHRAAQCAMTWISQQKTTLPVGHSPLKISPAVPTLAPISRQERQGLILAELKQLMWKQVGLIRHQSGLEQALQEIKKLKDEWLTMKDLSPEKKELENMLCVAELVAQAARTRRESRGAHFRSDYPSP